MDKAYILWINYLDHIKNNMYNITMSAEFETNVKTVIGNDGKQYNVEYEYTNTNGNGGMLQLGFKSTRVCPLDGGSFGMKICRVYNNPVIFYGQSVVVLLILLIMLIYVPQKNAIAVILGLYLIGRLVLIYMRFNSPVPLKKPE